LFGLPIGIILLVHFVAVLSGARVGGVMIGYASGRVSEMLLTFIHAGSSLLMSGANLIALIWFGLWMGLVSRNSLLATLKTIAFVQIIPWLVITFAGAMVIPLLALAGGFRGGAGAGSWLEWYPLISTLMVLTLTLVKDWTFWFMARRRLVDKFRATATQAIVPLGHAQSFSPVAPTTPGVPPVI
jgi:hypothetical protein